MNTYFTSEKHRENYDLLAAKFAHCNFHQNPDYRSTCYIAALPEIFQSFNYQKQDGGPFEWVFDFLNDRKDYTERTLRGETSGHPGILTGQTWAMVRIALSLWNGEKCDISDIGDLDHELYIVVLQALDLRRRKPSIQYTDIA